MGLGVPLRISCLVVGHEPCQRRGGDGAYGDACLVGGFVEYRAEVVGDGADGLMYSAFENVDGTYAFVVSNGTDSAQNITVDDGVHRFMAEVPAKGVASYRWQK